MEFLAYTWITNDLFLIAILIFLEDRTDKLDLFDMAGDELVL